jgi:hypothetical protein
MNDQEALNGITVNITSAGIRVECVHRLRPWALSWLIKILTVSLHIFRYLNMTGTALAIPSTEQEKPL